MPNDGNSSVGDFKNLDEAKAAFAELQKGMETLTKQLSDAQQLQKDQNHVIETLTIANAGSDDVDLTPPQLTALPDPKEDLEGYLRVDEENKRLTAEHQQKQQQWEQGRRKKLNNVWEGLQEENPELFDKGNDVITRQFVTDELTRINGLGVKDPTDYIIKNALTIKRHIVENATKYLTERKLIGEGSDDQNDDKGGQQTQPGNPLADRTAGIPGGMSGFPNPGEGSPGGGGGDDKKTFVDEIQDEQRATGFF